MKIGLLRHEFIGAMTPAMSAVSNKNTIKSIEGVLLTAEEGSPVCKISSYDMEKGVITSVPAKVYLPGSYIINAQRLYQIARALEGEEMVITVSAELTVKIDCGNSTFKLHAMPGSDFPALPAIQGERGFSMPQGEFRRMAGHITHAIGQNNPRPVLNNAFLRIAAGSLTFVGCDGFRIAMSEIAGTADVYGISGEGLSALIPGRTVTELMKIIADKDDILEIMLTRKHIIFKADEIYFFSRLAEGEYVDYNRIIPADHKIAARIGRDTLLGIIERAELVAEDKTAGNTRSHIKLKIGEGKGGGLLEVSSASASGSVYEETEIGHEGVEIEICFNGRYLIDAIRASDAEELRLTMNGPLSGIVIENNKPEAGKRVVFLVQPVRA